MARQEVAGGDLPHLVGILLLGHHPQEGALRLQTILSTKRLFRHLTVINHEDSVPFVDLPIHANFNNKYVEARKRLRLAHKVQTGGDKRDLDK